MNHTKVIVVLALFLTMKSTVGEPPANCYCAFPPSYVCGGYGTGGYGPALGGGVYCCYDAPSEGCVGYTNPNCCDFCCRDGGSGGVKTTTARAPLSTLSPECYSPDGTGCEWYKDCLEKKNPCQGKPDDYAVKYAKKYCDKYTENYNKFTETGQKWVDAVRKCLQIKLVPLVNQFSINITCKKIKDEAFASHTPCYAAPNAPYLTPSYCDLGSDDKRQAFSTVWTALIPPTFWKTVIGALDTWSMCDDIEARHIVPIRLVRVNMYTGLHYYQSVNEDDVDRLADEIGKGIALGIEVWDPVRLGYFAYLEPRIGSAKTYAQQLTIKMLIVDKFALDNMDNISITNSAQNYLDQTIDHLAQSIQQGKLEIKTANGTFYAKRMDQCLDMNCNTTDGNPAIAPSYNFAVHSVDINISVIMGFMSVLLFKNKRLSNR